VALRCAVLPLDGGEEANGNQFDFERIKNLMTPIFDKFCKRGENTPVIILSYLNKVDVKPIRSKHFFEFF
jgi:hypothetical protein